MNHLDWGHAAAGGVIIGIAASAMLIFLGRVMGVSGIVNRMFGVDRHDLFWRLAFVLGVIVGGFFAVHFWPENFSNIINESNYTRTALAGLVVGFGTRLGNGCTSGHGICGVGRLSPRSILATLTFIVTGMLTVMIFRILHEVSP